VGSPSHEPCRYPQPAGENASQPNAWNQGGAPRTQHGTEQNAGHEGADRGPFDPIHPHLFPYGSQCREKDDGLGGAQSGLHVDRRVALPVEEFEQEGNEKDATADPEETCKKSRNAATWEQEQPAHGARGWVGETEESGG